MSSRKTTSKLILWVKPYPDVIDLNLVEAKLDEVFLCAAASLLCSVLKVFYFLK